ncbi:MAG TPA: hypothetical protein VKG44_04650 [Candidatus Baltobacteraceae bacterium]|nr:hypothetical protein [Candidatus Baltobacteraceae bacterium]
MNYRSPLAGMVLASALCIGTVALAQVTPGDPGAGTQRGLQEMNNSGEPGTITLFTRNNGAKTLVVVELRGEPHARSQPAHVYRGKACDDISPAPAYSLAPVVNGVSRTLVEVPEAKLLSGNYVVVVHAADNKLDQYVSCGLLYQ